MDIKTTIKNLRDDGYIEGELSVEPLWYRIWNPNEIDQFNEDYEIQEYAPDFIGFGSNGGGELLVVDSHGAVFALPAIGMEAKYAIYIADSIEEMKKYMEKST